MLIHIMLGLGCSENNFKQSEVDPNKQDSAQTEPAGEPGIEPNSDTADTDSRPEFDFLKLPAQSVGQNNAIIDVHDVNSDGVPDLLTIADGGLLCWMEGDGTGVFVDQGQAWSGDLDDMMAMAFSDVEGNSIVVNDSRAERYQFVDWNADGQLDMLLSLSATNNAQPVYAVGIIESVFGTADWRPLQASNSPSNISIAASDGSFSFVIFNAPNIIFWDGAVLRPFPYESVHAVQGVAIYLDFNDDGLKDWAVMSDDGMGFKDFAIFYTLPDGTLETGPTAVPPSGQRLDYDLDEHWVPTLDGIFVLDPSQAWESALRYDPPVGYTLIGHYNADDRLDVLHEHIQNGVEAFAGLGSAELMEATTNGPLPQSGMISKDIDGSGTDDILWLQPTNGGTSLSVWINQR